MPFKPPLPARLDQLQADIAALERICAQERPPGGARGRLRMLLRKRRRYQLLGYLPGEPEPLPLRSLLPPLYRRQRTREGRIDVDPDVTLSVQDLLAM